MIIILVVIIFLLRNDECWLISLVSEYREKIDVGAMVVSSGSFNGSTTTTCVTTTTSRSTTDDDDDTNATW